MEVRDVERALAKFGYEEGPDVFEEEFPEHPSYGSYDTEWDELSYMLDKKGGVDVPGLGLVEKVDDYGGEGQGDDLWFVIKVTFPVGDDKFYRKSGYWVSHDGSYWDGEFEEVTPKQKTITVWS